MNVTPARSSTSLRRQRRINGQLHLPQGIPGPVVVQFPFQFQQQIPVRSGGYDLHTIPLFPILCFLICRLSRFSFYYNCPGYFFLSESGRGMKCSRLRRSRICGIIEIITGKGRMRT